MNNREINKAIQMFYATGVILGTAGFFTFGLITGNWAASLFSSVGGGLGFGLLMNGILLCKQR